MIDHFKLAGQGSEGMGQFVSECVAQAETTPQLHCAVLIVNMNVSQENICNMLKK
jgi:hypothetical protein